MSREYQKETFSAAKNDRHERKFVQILFVSFVYSNNDQFNDR